MGFISAAAIRPVPPWPDPTQRCTSTARYSKYVFETEGLEAALQAYLAVATSNGADASPAAVANTTVDGTSRGPVTTKNA